ncbi:hypothetical protein PC123_g24855 [Phytophthora cactorum]|nr:hypothetical protein PC123_g24855 [Phytophthora cactorum]
MESVEEGAIARLRVWRVGNDSSSNSESEGEDDAGEDDEVEVIEVVVRDWRNAYPNAFKLKVLDDINAGITVTEAARLHGIKSRTAVHGWIHREAVIRDACNHLEAAQRKFASEVGTKVSATYARACIFNADEMAVYYDATPTCIISERGSKKSVKIKGRTRSECASVLLIVSATGQKLRPVIIFKGQPGEGVEEEVGGISSRVVTAVQKNAWMDARVWLETFVEKSWGEFVSDMHPGPLALYVDNLKCHVNTESEEALAAWGTELVPLP